MNENGFVIKPPSTTGDDGSPTDSLWEDANRLFAFIDDERHLAARSLYRSIVDRLEAYKARLEVGVESPAKDSSGILTKSRSPKRTNKKESLARERRLLEVQKVERLMHKKAPQLTKLENHCKLFEDAKRNLSMNEDWTLAQTLFGITTYYRREPDGSLSIKLEGQLEGVPLFEQVAVLREVDLHSNWAPFCSSSLTITHLDKLDTVGWFVVGVPSFGLARDGCFRAIGCDSILEDGSILLVGEGLADRPPSNESGHKTSTDTANNTDGEAMQKLQQQSQHPNTSDRRYGNTDKPYALRDDPVIERLELPPVPTRMGSGRMTIRAFQAVIEITSPTSATSKLIANVDPNLSFLPQSLLDFLMKKLCGVLLHKLQGAAKRVAKDPVANPHAIKMRQEHAFYRDWLMVKFKHICDIRGWTMPPVPAFELSPQQHIQAMRAEEKLLNANKRRFVHTRSADSIEYQRTHQQKAISTHSEPHVACRDHPSQSPFRASVADSDTVSELSLNSSSTISSIWRNNPISAYLREVEEKTQMRKAEAISRAREIAATRLRPKTLQVDQQARLAELRAVRGMTLADAQNGTAAFAGNNECGSGPTTPRSVSDGTDAEVSYMGKSREYWMTNWSDHGRAMRVTVVASLFVVLFGTLSMKPVIGKTLFAISDDRWYVATAKDIGTIAYMLLAASIHFGLCYISLVYSFSALHIGQIAGEKAKRFYSENVHLLVASTSAGIVVVSLLKVSLCVSFRYVTWLAVRLRRFPSAVVRHLHPGESAAVASAYRRAMVETSIGRFFGETVVPYVRTVQSCAGWLLSRSVSALSHVATILHSVWLQSNVVGRTVSSFATWLTGMFGEAYRSWTGYVANVIEIMEHDGVSQSWRQSAFETTSRMLLYSAMFLLVLLVLFASSVRNIRSSEKDKRVLDPGGAVDKDRRGSRLGSSNVQRKSLLRADGAQRASGTKRIDTINEVEEYSGALIRNGTVVSVGTPAASRRRRRYVKSGPRSRK